MTSSHPLERLVTKAVAVFASIIAGAFGAVVLAYEAVVEHHRHHPTAT